MQSLDADGIVYRLVPRGGSLDTTFRLIVLERGVNLPFVMMALVAGGTLNCGGTTINL